MNKKGKLLLVLLSAATMTAGVLGIAGCKKDNNSGDNAKDAYSAYDKKSDSKDAPTGKENTQDVYSAYVQYTEAKGKTPLSYDAWLEAIKGELFVKGDDGAAGAPGKPGNPGKPGKPGENGVSITEVTLSNDGAALEIHYSNGKTDSVTLAEAVTHVHAYDDESVTTLIPSTADKEGLGYKVCSDEGCDHVELVILSQRYLVTVSDAGGEPVAGAQVYINGATAVTGDDGIASVHGYGYKNDYIVAVEKQGMTVAGTVRAGNENSINVTLINEFDTTTYRNDPYPAVKGEGNYNVVVKSKDYGGGQVMVDKTMVLLCNETDEYKNYRITLGGAESDDAKIVDENDNELLKEGSKVLEIVVEPQTKVPVQFWYDMAKFTMNGHKAGESVSYIAKVEEIEVPDIGTETLRKKAATGTEITIPAGKTDWLYCTWENVSEDVLKVAFSMTNVEVEFTAKEGAYNRTDKEPTAAVQGDPIVLLTKGPNDYWDPQPNAFLGTYKFRVRLTDSTAEGKFTLNAIADPGTLTNPYEYSTATGNGTISSADTNGNIYFKVTVAEKGKYLVKWTSCYDVKIYNGKPEKAYALSDVQLENSTTVGAYAIVELEAGEYYFRASVQNDPLELVFRKFDANTDKGMTVDNPVALEDVTFDTDGNYVITKNHVGYVYEKIYYSFTAPTKGSATVSVDKKYYYTVSVENGSKFNAGDTVVICIGFSGYSDSTANYTINWTEDKTVEPVTPDPGPDDPEVKPTVADHAEHTFTAKDANGNKLAGVTVSLTADFVGDDGEVTQKAFEGTTDADGVVKFTFLPGAYEVTVGGAYESNAEYKLSKKEDVVKNVRSFDIVYAVKKDHKVKVADSKGVAVANVKVTVVISETEKLEGTTGADGSVTLNFFPGAYKIELSEFDGSAYKYEGGTTAANLGESTVTLRNDAYVYNLTVKSGATAFANTVVKLQDAKGNVYGEGTTDEAGEVTIKIYYPATGVSALNCNVELSEEQAEEYGFTLDRLPEIKKANEPGTEAVKIALVQKTAYTVNVLNPDGVAVQGVKVKLVYGEGSSAKVMDEAVTGENGEVTVKAVAEDFSIVCEDVPEGTNAPVLNVAEGTVSYTVNLAVGDKAVTGANGNTLSALNSDACAMVKGINALTNSAELNYYKFSASGSGTFTFNVTEGAGSSSYISYFKVGDDVLILNGQQQLVKYGVILGANRGLNKAYEVSITIEGSVQVVIGYATGTGEGGAGQLTVAEKNVVKPADLQSGANNLTFKDGFAQLVCDVDAETDLILTWEGEATVYIDGTEYTNGDRITLPVGECEILIESSLETLTLNAEFKTPLQRYRLQEGDNTVTLDGGYALVY